MTKIISYENLNIRAAKAFGASFSSKSFTNLPTQTQDALLTLEMIVRCIGVLVRDDTSAFGHRCNFASLGRQLQN